MRAVALLSLLVLVNSAPVDEQISNDNGVLQEEEKVNLVKRAKEFMMFADVDQGVTKEKEKRSGDLEDTIDQQGSVVAHQPEEVPVEQPSEELIEADVEAPQIGSEENTELPVADNMGNEEVQEASRADSEEEEEETENIPEESDGLENVEQDSSENEDSMELTPEAAMYDDYLKSYKNYKNEAAPQGSYLMDLLNQPYKQWEPQGYINPNSYSLYDVLGGGRYRRSEHVRRLAGSPKNRILKRARRIKRDLYFTSDILGRNYDPYEEEQYLDRPYGAEQVDLDDDDVRYLLNLLDDSEGYNDDATLYDNQPYPVGAGYYEPEFESDDSDFYIPKRQAGLTFVPGLKRSNSFFPTFREPDSHFNAFVPQKRSRNDYDYADAYRRLMELAELMAGKYYPDEGYDGNYYRRK